MTQDCACVQDTAAATQALAVYTLAKQGLNEVNLHCNVTTRPTLDYTHSFDFTVDNAITPKSLSNVSCCGNVCQELWAGKVFFW